MPGTENNPRYKRARVIGRLIEYTKKAEASHKMLAVVAVFGVIGLILMQASRAAVNPNLSGDLNNDNKVTVADLSILLSNFNKTTDAADLNGDGKVNVADLSVLLSNFGKTYTPGTTPPTPPPTTPPPTPPVTGGTSIAQYGAKCDGSSDDTAAFQAGLKAGGTLTIPDGNCLINGGNIALGSNSTIRGTTANSALTFTAANSVMIVDGSNTTFSYVKLNYTGPSGVLFWFSSASMSGFTLDHATLDGRMDQKPNGYIHGIWFADGGNYKDIKVLNSTMTRFDFAFGINSIFPGAINNIVVDSSEFYHNYGDDVEINAPETDNVRNVTVANNTFRDNLFNDIGLAKGIGAGFANVHDGVVKNNTFSNYYAQPLHIEDRSSNFLVEGNRFSNGGRVPLGHAAYIYVLSNAHDITVNNNVIDASANTNPVWCFYASPGGPAPLIDPFNLKGTGNTCKKGSAGQVSIGQWQLTDTTVQ